MFLEWSFEAFRYWIKYLSTDKNELLILLEYVNFSKDSTLTGSV